MHQYKNLEGKLKMIPDQILGDVIEKKHSNQEGSLMNNGGDLFDPQFVKH